MTQENFEKAQEIRLRMAHIDNAVGIVDSLIRAVKTGQGNIQLMESIRTLIWGLGEENVVKCLESLKSCKDDYRKQLEEEFEKL